MPGSLDVSTPLPAVPSAASAPRRRHALRSLAVASLLGVPAVRRARAATGARTLRLIVPSAPGGSSDPLLRAIGAHVSLGLGVPLAVEFQAGAGGVLGADKVARAAPDGFTVLHAPGSLMTAAPHLYLRLPYDPERDFQPVSRVAGTALALVASPTLPVQTLDELLELARRQPGALAYASLGNGSLSHLNAELLEHHAGVTLQHTPYRGSRLALDDLLQGRVAMMFDALAAVLPHVRGGRLRALAVTGPSRASALPEVPALAERIPDFDGRGWIGWFVPAATPRAGVDRLHAELGRALREPDVRRLLADLHFEPLGDGPAEARAVIADQSRRWREVISRYGIRLD